MPKNIFHDILREQLLPPLNEKSYKTIGNDSKNNSQESSTFISKYGQWYIHSAVFLLSRIEQRYRVIADPMLNEDALVSFFKHKNSDYTHKATNICISISYLSSNEMAHSVFFMDTPRDDPEEYRLADLVHMAKRFIFRNPKELFRFRYINQIMRLNSFGLFEPSFIGNPKFVYDINKVLSDILGPKASVEFSKVFKRVPRDASAKVCIILVTPEIRKIQRVLEKLFLGIFGPDFHNNESNYTRVLTDNKKRLVQDYGEDYACPGLLMIRDTSLKKSDSSKGTLECLNNISSVILTESGSTFKTYPTFNDIKELDYKIIKCLNPDDVNIREDTSGLFSLQEILEYLSDSINHDTDYEYGINYDSY